MHAHMHAYTHTHTHTLSLPLSLFLRPSHLSHSHRMMYDSVEAMSLPLNALMCDSTQVLKGGGRYRHLSVVTFQNRKEPSEVKEEDDGEDDGAFVLSGCAVRAGSAVWRTQQQRTTTRCRLVCSRWSNRQFGRAWQAMQHKRHG